MGPGMLPQQVLVLLRGKSFRRRGFVTAELWLLPHRMDGGHIGSHDGTHKNSRESHSG